MSTPCTTPLQPGDTRYVFGQDCTWHGPISFAGSKGGVPCCPFCGGALNEIPSEDVWWARVASENRARPEVEPMLQWSRLRCFPDVETLENAYRQDMEGQQ